MMILINSLINSPYNVINDLANKTQPASWTVGSRSQDFIFELKVYCIK